MKTVEPWAFISDAMVVIGSGEKEKWGKPALMDRWPVGGYFETSIARFASSITSIENSQRKRFRCCKSSRSER